MSVEVISVAGAPTRRPAMGLVPSLSSACRWPRGWKASWKRPACCSSFVHRKGDANGHMHEYLTLTAYKRALTL
jgi:hypothetical protein